MQNLALRRSMLLPVLRGLLCCMLSTASPLMTIAADNTPSQTDLNKLNEAIERVEEQLSTVTSERETLQQSLFASEKQISELTSSIQILNSRIASERAKQLELQSRSTELNNQRTQQQQTIGRYMRSAWQSGQQEYLKLLLNQEDIALASRTMQYYQHFNQARSNKIKDFNDILDEIDVVSAGLATTSANLKANQQTLTQQRVSLESTQNERQQQMTALDVILTQSGEDLARLMQEREELTLLIEELNRSIAALSATGSQTPFAQMKGKLPWPVSGPLLNSFGSRHELGDVTWQGVDIRASAGTEVQAIHGGQVIYADWFSNSGLLMIIDHGDGYMSLYAQNQQLLRAVGDWVNAGDIISTVGNTGGRQDPALYFEIRKDGDAQDPITWSLPRS